MSRERQKYLYRIVDKDGNVVDETGDERRSDADESRKWHNVHYPETKPHRIQRTPVKRVWEDVR